MEESGGRRGLADDSPWPCSHRRVLTAHLIAYKQADDDKRKATLDGLAAEAQRRGGLGY